ncbi:MAG TPA: DUF4268 domain-containing protein [Flavisolibacter sp.]|nr:DUF4268 domain-containing protein [Flavisolibacter sp.]
MYSKQEASILKQQFWTSFGLYMNPVLSSEGEKINWVNYKTGEKNIRFKMHADSKSAFAGIVLTHKDAGIRELYFEQLVELKSIMQKMVPGSWHWLLNSEDENGQPISIVYDEIEGVSIFNKEDWPKLISFFKPRIVALDEFWNMVKYSFESLK